MLGVGATTLGILITSIPCAHATNTNSQNQSHASTCLSSLHPIYNFRLTQGAIQNP